MNTQNSVFNEHTVLHDLKHYLPAQAPLKDFIHHNTLHAFQHLKFYEATANAREIFGYKVSLTLNDYRNLYQQGRIRQDILDRILIERKGMAHHSEWKEKLLNGTFKHPATPRIGTLRANWKRSYHIDLDSLVHPLLFRLLCSYLDQGISIWNFPVKDKTFLAAVREIERTNFTSLFRHARAKELLLRTTCDITALLKVLIGDESLYQHYLFDQQFAHQGWSGMVSAIEDQPQTLLDQKKISIHDLIVFELLLEIDALDSVFGVGKWKPLGDQITERPVDLFSNVYSSELVEVLILWQDAFEWSYYDQVLTGIKGTQLNAPRKKAGTFQAMFCIDDRECSLRRYLEKSDPNCETFGTPGFFNVEFFYQPEGGKFFTKLCPAPVTPKYLVKEMGALRKSDQRDFHLTKHSHSFYSGWLISNTLGLWAAFRLFLNIFKPSMGPATASSFKHMDRFSRLTIENKNTHHRENDLQIGFTIPEMATRVEGLLKSIGLVKDFAPIVYIIGHGSSSVNNPHYAAYDCGACSGRAGSVNARVICAMANRFEVREILRLKGIDIPDETQFVGGLHDTTRDEIVFFDENSLSPENLQAHVGNEVIFSNALDSNAKERSRRFESINTKGKADNIHEKVKRRSVSLFEPRPELNHATNALCVVGRRALTKSLFFDRRAFMNSYDYALDPDGTLLFNVMKPLGPVCGGINLEYYFSRVDNQKLGAGTKLPHNVMGLFGVANGIDGDLRPGLPSQMIEVHDPIRLMVIVEHFPDVVLNVIKKAPEVYEWFKNEWVHLAAVNPETHEISVFKDGRFNPYQPVKPSVDTIADVTSLIEAGQENLPVYSIA
jgi:uncharacterized protein YbcC (UPF0753/DUF2309 family)